MLGYVLSIMTIAVLSHITSIPSSSAAPQNYILPSIPLLSSGSREELSLSPSRSRSSSTEDYDNLSLMEADDDEDSSTSSSEYSRIRSPEGKKGTLQTIISSEDTPLHLTSRFRDEPVLSKLTSDEVDNSFPYTRKSHDHDESLDIFHYIPNYLERSSRFPVEMVKIGSNRQVNQLTGDTMRHYSNEEDHEYISQEHNSPGLHGEFGVRHGLWNIIPIVPVPMHTGRSNYPSNSVGKRNDSVKRLKQSINNLHEIQENYGEGSTTVFTRNEKRSPRCLRRCLAQGLLHPTQCHSLC